MVICALILCNFQKTNAQKASRYWSLSGNSNATSSSKLGTTRAVDLRIITNNSERVRITSNGNVGIGTNSPNTRVQVNSIAGANPFKAQINGVTKLFVHSDGGVSIGRLSTPPVDG